MYPDDKEKEPSQSTKAIKPLEPEKKKEKKQSSLLRKILHLVVIFALINIFAVITIRVVTMQLQKNVLPLELHKQPQKFAKRTRRGTFMKLQNLKFRLTDKIDMQVKTLTAEAIPKGNETMVNFDDIHSFAIDILQGEVLLKPHVLETIFNDIVFNFPGSPLKNQKMEFVKIDGKKERRLKLTGEMKLVFWIPFEMIAKISLDKKKVLMIIEAESIRSLGNPYTKTLLDMVGLDLETLLPIPAGRGLEMKENKIIVQPFEIFPPPQIGGYLTDIQLLENAMFLKFDNPHKVNFPEMPVPEAKNYLFLYKGDVKFGKLRMIDARLQMIDLNQKDAFDFYLKKYFNALARGYSKIRFDKSVVAYLPDHR